MANKMTQKNALVYVLNNCDLPVEVSNKLTDMLHALAKKSANNGERKPSAHQTENESIKAQVMSVLSESEKGLTISELSAQLNIEGLTSQRLTALVTQLVGKGVTRTMVKRKAVFSITSEE